ncbi:MAG: hypothetical protein HWE16_03670 [Gammaproteobacteria bacterium]|nr:hypothetical protein [Gammaproteobacteria bacterium]
MNQGQGETRGDTASKPVLALDKEVILTINGSEHEDIMLTISEILYRFKGSIISNHFHRIGLQFTGMMKIAINHMYLKPFISCLDSLASYSVRFDTQILGVEQSQRIDEQIRFDFEIWGPENPEFRLKFLQWLNRHRLVVESTQDNIKPDSHGQLQISAHVRVATEYVVDEQEIQDEIYQLAQESGITILLLNPEIDENLEDMELKQAI